MEFVMKIRDWLNGDTARITVSIALLGIVWRLFIDYLNYQSMDDVEHVFLTKKQQITFKLSNFLTASFMIFIYLFISTETMKAEAYQVILEVLFYIALFLLFIIYPAYLFLYWILRKINKTEKVSCKCIEFIKYLCELVIGMVIVMRVYIETKDYFLVLVICAVVSITVTFFVTTGMNAMQERKSRVFMQEGNQNYYIYYKRDNCYVCGNNAMRKDATELKLMSFKNITKKNWSIQLKENNIKEEKALKEKKKGEKMVHRTNLYKDLDEKLKQARKITGRFNMESKSEKIIDDFYKNHQELDNNRLSNRFRRVKEYDEKFKVLILPIFIAVCFGILLSGSQLLLSYQKSITIDVMNQEWRTAQEKIENIQMTETSQKLINEMHDGYRRTMVSLWGVFIIMVVLLGALIFVCISPFDIWYDHRTRKSYQREYERNYLENLLNKKREIEKELIKIREDVEGQQYNQQG